MIAHDNLPRIDHGGREVYARPTETQRGMGLSDVPLEPYPDDPDAGQPLASTWRDAERMASFLHRFTESRLTVAAPGAAAVPKDAARAPNTRDGVRDALRDLRCNLAIRHGRETGDGCLQIEPPPRDTRKWDDIVVVHFSGHGVHQGLMLADDVYPARAFADDVQALVTAGADLVVVLLDSCYGSGVLDGETRTIVPQRDIPPVTASNGRVAVFAAASTVPEFPDIGSGALTHVILSGLAGAADENGDGTVQFAELSDFFLLHTDNSSGHFAARVRSPGGNQLRPVLDLDRGTAQVPVTVARGAAGRFLVADDGGAITELHARKQHVRRGVTVHVPAADDPWSLYFLPVDAAGRPASAQVFRRDWTPEGAGARFEEFGHPGAKGHLPDYLLSTQGGDGMFSRGTLLPNARKLGRQVTARLGVGYLGTEAWGRIEDTDVRAQDGEAKDLYRFIQDREPAWWNLAGADLTVRLHPVTPAHVELRLQLAGTPVARVSAAPASLLMTRALLGGGLSGHLRSRSWVGHAEGGVGLVGLQAERTTGDGGPRDPIPLADRTPTTLWAGAGLVHRRKVGVTLDLHAFRDTVRLTGESQPRPYVAILGSIGAELIRRGF